MNKNEYIYMRSHEVSHGSTVVIEKILTKSLIKALSLYYRIFQNNHTAVFWGPKIPVSEFI